MYICACNIQGVLNVISRFSGLQADDLLVSVLAEYASMGTFFVSCYASCYFYYMIPGVESGAYSSTRS